MSNMIAKAFRGFGVLLFLLPPIHAAAQEPRNARPDSNWVLAAGEYQSFRGDLDPWTLFSVEGGHRAKRGSIMARIHRAERFSQRGYQVEADAYPKFGKDTYAYLNAGRSDSAIFPRWRWGTELFHVFSRGVEVSAGVRHLQFVSPATIYTGSLGKYWGNYWASLRPYVVDRRSQTTTSASLTIRRYLATADDYVSLGIAGGRTPRDPVLAREAGVSRWEASVSGQRRFGAAFVQYGMALQSQDVGGSEPRRSTIARLAVGRRF